MRLKHLLIYLSTSISLIGLSLTGCSQQRTFETELMSNSVTQAQTFNRDVPYVPTPNEVMKQMLKMAKVTENDVVYDLGSGDGRIVINAAQTYGARGVGVEIDPELVKKATENAQKAGVSNLVEFRQQDLFQADISEATVVTLYLLPNVNLRLKSKLLEELKPGTRIVSHAFDMGDWQPQQVEQVNGTTIYYWVVPNR